MCIRDRDKVTIKDFSPTQDITAQDIQENEATISNIPINDQKPTKDMYNSLQGIRNYYKFYDVDVDRYFVDGKYTQVFLGTREMENSALPDDAKTWVNQHLKYTHGFGVAMSPVNKTNSVGQPELIVKDIPPVTDTPVSYTHLDVYKRQSLCWKMVLQFATLFTPKWKNSCLKT